MKEFFENRKRRNFCSVYFDSKHSFTSVERRCVFPIEWTEEQIKNYFCTNMEVSKVRVKKHSIESVICLEETIQSVIDKLEDRMLVEKFWDDAKIYLAELCNECSMVIVAGMDTVEEDIKAFILKDSGQVPNYVDYYSDCWVKKEQPL